MPRARSAAVGGPRRDRRPARAGWLRAAGALGATVLALVGLTPAASAIDTGALTGTVTLPAGTPPSVLAAVEVHALGAGLGSDIVTTVAADGTFELTELAADDYKVMVVPPTDSGLVGEYFDDVHTWAAASTLAVTTGPVGGIDVTLGLGGSVAGTVMLPDGFDPADAQVALLAPGLPPVEVPVAADGTYMSDALVPATYTVRFESAAPDLLTEYWNGSATADGATPVIVGAGLQVTGIDGELALGGGITGTVTVPAGYTIDSTFGVTAFSEDPDAGYGLATVAADGSYAVRGLRAGQYRVAFGAGESGLVGEYWDDALTYDGAALVDVVLGAQTPGVDAALAVGGSVAGTVSGPDGPVAGAAVSLSGGEVFLDAVTDPTGHYVIPGLPAGSYTVRFTGPVGSGLIREYYDDSPTRAGATPVVVLEAQDRVGIDAVLAAGGSVSGVVTVPAGFSPTSVQVTASPASVGASTGSAAVAADGTYTIPGLTSGSYVISFSGGPDLVHEYWQDTTSYDLATLVPVTQGVETPGIDAALVPGGSISGTVRDADGPVEGVDVSAVSADGGGTTTTAADGTWLIAGLSPGDYLVGFVPAAGSLLVPEYYDDALGWLDAATVPLTLGSAATGIDAVLDLGAGLGGTVTRSDGSPVAGATVTVAGTGVGSFVLRSAQTGADGSYQVDGVPAGSYLVRADVDDPALQHRFWPDAAAEADADLLDLAVAEVRTAIDIVLPPAGAITGSVTVPSGFDAYCVTASGATDAGSACAEAGVPYTIGGLSDGSYVVEAEAYDAQTSAQTSTRFHVDAERRSQATAVAVTVPDVHGGVDIDLSAVPTLGVADAALSLTADPEVPALDEAVSVTVALTGPAGTPEGVVELWGAEGFLGDAVLVAGSATLSHAFTDPAATWLEATYRGSASYAPTSGYLDVIVEELVPTVVTLTSSANPALEGAPVTFTAVVGAASGSPTGTVTFDGPDGPLGTVALTGDRATLVVDHLGLGSSLVTATYDGSVSHAVSSAQLTQVVELPPPPTVVSVEPPSGSVLGGTPVRIHGTGLLDVTAVTFGGVPGTALQVVSATELEVTTPPGPLGSAAVVLSAPQGDSTGDAAFSYVDYVTQTPVRVLSNLAVTPGVPRCVLVAGVAGVPAAAAGVVVNVTTVRPNGPGYVVVYPDSAGTGSTPAPNASTVNFEPGADVANATFVELPTSGKICYATAGASSVGVLIDVAGYTLLGSGVVLQASTRVLDTRAGAAHVGTVTGPVAPRQVATVDVAGQAGVPDDASAVILNVTVTGVTGGGNLRVFPAGGPVPNTSVVNYAAGLDKANGTIVALPASGEVSFWSDAGGTVQVILDVVGYVAAPSSYVGMTPTRVLDTRAGAGHLGPIPGALAARTVYSVDLATGPVPPGATAVVLNVTAIGPTARGNLRVYPDADGTGATPPPNASSLNYIVGRDIPNQVVVALPADGKVNFYSDMIGGTVHLAADVVGYVTAPAG